MATLKTLMEVLPEKSGRKAFLHKTRAGEIAPDADLTVRAGHEAMVTSRAAPVFEAVHDIPWALQRYANLCEAETPLAGPQEIPAPAVPQSQAEVAMDGIDDLQIFMSDDAIEDIYDTDDPFNTHDIGGWDDPEGLDILTGIEDESDPWDDHMYEKQPLLPQTNTFDAVLHHLGCLEGREEATLNANVMARWQNYDWTSPPRCLRRMLRGERPQFNKLAGGLMRPQDSADRVAGVRISEAAPEDPEVALQRPEDAQAAWLEEYLQEFRREHRRAHNLGEGAGRARRWRNADQSSSSSSAGGWLYSSS